VVVAPAQLNPDEAEALWREAVELRKGSKKRHHKKAIKTAQRMIAEAPNTPETLGRLHCFIADCYSQQLGDHDRAIEYYLLALEHNPGESLAGSNLGHVLLAHKKDPEAAARILQQTLDRGVSDAFIRATTEDLLSDARRELGSG
jgi:tetratricopeptide (TPR) repeat protein